MKKLMLMILYLLMFTILVGCNTEGETDDNSQDEVNETESEEAKEVRVAMNAQPPNLDTHITTAAATRDVGQHMFESLVTLNSKYQAVPMLAESIDISDDNRTYTFHLREGVTFHNGKEMTSEDVVASMERWKNHDAMALSLLSDASFEANGKYTVDLVMENPSTLILPIIAGSKQIASIMPKEVVDAASADGVDEYIGTGPFKMEEWRQDQFIHLTAFEDYQPVEEPTDGLSGKKEALIDHLYFDIVTDSSTRLVGLQTGEYDISLQLPYDNYEQIESEQSLVPDINLHSTLNVVFNKKEGVLSDEKMRQAFNAALDMEKILLAAYSHETFYRLDSGYVFPEQEDWYSDAGDDRYNQNDPELAQRLMEEAGYDGEEILLMISRDYEQMYNAGVVIQEQLESVGMNVTIEVVDWPTQQDRMHHPDQHDAFITFFTTVATPLHLLYLNSSWPGWTDDPDISSLLNDISSAESMEEAKDSWDQLQDRAYTYLPVANLGHAYSFNGLSNKLDGYEYFLGPNLWNTTISE